MTIKEFFSLKTTKYFGANLVAMIVVVVAVVWGALEGLDSYTHHGQAVLVPDAEGMTVEEATNVFRKQGLECLVSDSSYVKNKPAGIILDLKPSAGQKVKQGRIVYLTINTLNVPLRAVPDVADNSSMRQAQAIIMAAGFKLNEIESVTGEKDWVYGVKYQGRLLMAGDKVPLGALLTLMVGNGEADVLPTDSTGGEGVEIKESDSQSGGSSHDDDWF